MDELTNAAINVVETYRHYVECDNNHTVSVQDWDVAQREMNAALNKLSILVGMGGELKLPELACFSLNELDTTIKRMQQAAVMPNKPLAAIHGIEIDNAANN